MNTEDFKYGWVEARVILVYEIDGVTYEHNDVHKFRVKEAS